MGPILSNFQIDTDIQWLYAYRMNDVQERLDHLRVKGWTDAAIADEVGVQPLAITRWRSGKRYPENAKMVIMGLVSLLERKRIPKRRRYEGTHHLQRKPQQQE